MFESPEERAALHAFTGEYALVGSRRIAGHFDALASDDIGAEGTAPTFQADRDALVAASVGKGSTLDAVHTVTGRVEGPFRVVRWMPEGDGASIVLGLQQL